MYPFVVIIIIIIIIIIITIIKRIFFKCRAVKKLLEHFTEVKQLMTMSHMRVYEKESFEMLLVMVIKSTSNGYALRKI